jgi:hypothetical protein
VVNKDWLDIDVLEDYLDGKLDAKTMNRVEREALEDPFVAEALAGLSASPRRALESISLLQKQLKDRIAQQQITKKQAVITWQRLSIGSAAAVLFITVGIVYWMKQVNYDKVLNSTKKVDVVIAPRKDKDAISPKAVIPKTLTLPKEEAIASLKKAKDISTAGAGVVSKDKVAVVQPQVQSQIALSRSSALSATSIAMPDAYSSDMIRGKVVDETTGNPMVGAYVSAKDSQGILRVVATADVNGEFAFRKADSIVDSTITVSYVSYDTKVLPIKDHQQLAISLKETSNIPGNQTVIRGYVKRSKEQTSGSTFIVSGKEAADVPVGNVEQLLQGKVGSLNVQNNTGTPAAKSHPLEGWDHYYMYITNNSKFKGEPRVGKSVELSFNVDTAGRAQNIKVTVGIARKFNNEAIRLVKEGPRWLKPEQANAKITLKIDF